MGLGHMKNYLAKKVRALLQGASRDDAIEILEDMLLELKSHKAGLKWLKSGQNNDIWHKAN
jgi:hypothetical protein